MQRFEAAVILMEKNLDKVEFLIGDKLEYNQGLLNEQSLDLF